MDVVPVTLMIVLSCPYHEWFCTVRNRKYNCGRCSLLFTTTWWINDTPSVGCTWGCCKYKRFCSSIILLENTGRNITHLLLWQRYLCYTLIAIQTAVNLRYFWYNCSSDLWQLLLWAIIIFNRCYEGSELLRAHYTGRNITHLLLWQHYLCYTLVTIQTATNLRYSFVLWWELCSLYHKVFIVLISTFMAQWSISQLTFTTTYSPHYQHTASEDCLLNTGTSSRNLRYFSDSSQTHPR